MYFSDFATLSVWATVAGALSCTAQSSEGGSFQRMLKRQTWVRVSLHLKQSLIYCVQWQLGQRLWESNYTSKDGQIYYLKTTRELSGTGSYDKDCALLQPKAFPGFWPSFVSGSATEEGIKIMCLMEPIKAVRIKDYWLFIRQNSVSSQKKRWTAFHTALFNCPVLCISFCFTITF